MLENLSSYFSLALNFITDIGSLIFQKGFLTNLLLNDRIGLFFVIVIVICLFFLSLIIKKEKIEVSDSIFFVILLMLIIGCIFSLMADFIEKNIITDIENRIENQLYEKIEKIERQISSLRNDFNVKFNYLIDNLTNSGKEQNSINDKQGLVST